MACPVYSLCMYKIIFNNKTYLLKYKVIYFTIIIQDIPFLLFTIFKFIVFLIHYLINKIILPC